MASESSSDSRESIVVEGAQVEGIQFSEKDSTLLMSLLEESQVEDVEEERLQCIIQSLEAEIHPNMTTIPELDGQGNHKDYGLQDFGLEDPYDVWASHSLTTHELDWMDMEMNSSSTPSDDELASIMEFYGVSLEELAYGCVWQETYDPMFCN